jgi:hypothetical protein
MKLTLNKKKLKNLSQNQQVFDKKLTPNVVGGAVAAPAANWSMAGSCGFICGDCITR